MARELTGTGLQAGKTVRAFQGVIGVTIVLYKEGRALAWAIAGGSWNWKPGEASKVTTSMAPTDVPEWASIEKGGNF